jgi:hypothetical protein
MKRDTREWVAAIPFIKSNPFTGHGFQIGGYVIQCSIDTYVVCRSSSRLGSSDLQFSGGLVLLPIWYGLRSYLSDMSEFGAASGALACSFVAFTAYRLALSQKENHMLSFRSRSSLC